MIAVMVRTGRLLTWMPAGRNVGRNAKPLAKGVRASLDTA